MDTYAEQVDIAKEYIAKAGINFSPFQLANLFSGLDFERYEILRLIPQSARSIVIIQKSEMQGSRRSSLLFAVSRRWTVFQHVGRAETVL